MGKTYSPKERVKRAKNLIGEQSYSITDRNCHHIATECVTGEAKSDQGEAVKTAKDVAEVALATTVFGPVVGGTIVLAKKVLGSSK